MYQADAHREHDPRAGHEEDSIRHDRVAEARQKLEAGEYGRPEVVEAVVERLISSITAHQKP